MRRECGWGRGEAGGGGGGGGGGLKPNSNPNLNPNTYPYFIRNVYKTMQKFKIQPVLPPPPHLAETRKRGKRKKDNISNKYMYTESSQKQTVRRKSEVWTGIWGTGGGQRNGWWGWGGGRGEMARGGGG
jgi:hypothetical protein